MSKFDAIHVLTLTLFLHIVNAEQTTCKPALIECVNGGTISPDGCRETLTYRESAFGAITQCWCPSAYTGPECSIVAQRSICRDRWVYDGNALSEYRSQRLECALDPTIDSFSSSQQSSFTSSIDEQNLQLALNELRDHRMQIDVDWPNRMISLKLISRHYSRGWVNSVYVNAHTIVDYSFSECNELFEHNLSNTRRIRCSKITRNSHVHNDTNATQFHAINNAFNSLIFIIFNIEGEASSVRVGVSVFNGRNASCMVGSCRAPSSSDEAMRYVMPIIAIIIVLILIAFILGVYIELFHPPAGIQRRLEMLLRDSSQEDVSTGERNAALVQCDTLSPALHRRKMSRLSSVGAESMPALGIVWHNVSYRVDARNDNGSPSIALFLKYFVIPIQTYVRRRRAENEHSSSSSSSSSFDTLEDSLTHTNENEAVSNHQITLLPQCSGLVRAGEMVAIIGSSGAGKSTLLDILAGSVKRGSVSGRVEICHPISSDNRYRAQDVLAYVVQTDLSLDTMTVWETLFFAARMRLPRSMSEDELYARVAEILDEVGLSHIALSLVGSAESAGISGGERRRLALGVELISNPRILLLDEPTSGLDSYYAEAIVRVLRRRASTHRCSIVLSIHQPPAHLFPLFDRIVLMGSRGRVAFNGAPQQAIAFIENYHQKKMLHGANPFEFLVDALQRDHSTHTQVLSSTVSNTHINSLVAAFQSSENFAILTKEVEQALQCEAKSDTLPKASQNRLLFTEQVRMLVWRSFRHVSRDASLLLMYNLITLFVALLSALTFYDLGVDESATQNRIGFAYCAIVFGALLSMSSIDLFLTERALFWRETSAGSYTSGAYFVSKLVVDLLPFRVLPALTFSCAAYYLVGFQPDLFHFFGFASTLILSNLVAGATIFAISAGSKDVQTASLIGIIYFVFNIVFGGPFLSQSQAYSNYSNNALSQTSSWFSSTYLSYLSFFYYAFEIVVTREFLGLTFVMNEGKTHVGADNDIEGQLVEFTGESILEMMSWRPDRVLLNATVLILLCISLNIFAFMLLRFTQRRHAN